MHRYFTKTAENYSKLIDLYINSDINLVGEDLDAIISAIRGPDFEEKDWSLEVKQQYENNHPCELTYRLKWLTTARIRAIVNPDHYGNVNLALLSNIEIDERNFLMKHSPSRHFIHHYTSAVQAIIRLYRWDLMLEEVVIAK